MASVTIPFVGSFTNPTVPELSFSDSGFLYPRGQLFNNCVFSRIVNQATQSQTVAVEKRPGMIKGDTYGGGTETFTALTAPTFNISSYFGAYGATNSNIVGAVDVSNTFATSGSRVCGAITGICRSIAESIYDGVGVIAIVSSDGTGWFYAMDAGTASPTFTATTTNGSPTLTVVSSFSGLYIGQALSGTGIPATARIQAMNSGASTITMGSDSATTVNATASNSGVTITRTPIAKIIDVDFPSAVGKFVFVDGYAFVMTESARVYQSALNSITSWGAADYITSNLSNDAGVSLARYKNQILAFGTESCEFFFNAGNPSGSVLGRSEQNFFKVGAYGANSIVNIEDTIYWLGISGSSGASVYGMDGFTPVKISTSEVDSILNILVGGVSVSTVVYLGGARVCGSINLFLTNINRGLTSGASWGNSNSILYDVDKKIWHTWSPGVSGLSFHVPAYVARSNETRFGGISNGTLYKISPREISYFKDNTTDGTDGTAYVMAVITKKLNFGINNRKFLSKIALNCDRHSTGSVTLYYMDDDSLNISQAATNSLGIFDISKSNPMINRGGSWVGGRIFYFFHNEAEDFRMESATFDYEVGVH